jgi:hypothetical protein
MGFYDQILSGGWPWLKVLSLVWALIAAPFLYVWILVHYSQVSQKRKYKLPPGPPTWPIIGGIPSLIASKPAHQVVCDLSKVYGPIVLVKFGVNNLVFINNAELTMEIIKAQDHLFAYRPVGLPSKKYLLYGENHLGKPCKANTV